MTQAFYLDAAPPGELIALYVRHWASLGQSIVWHGPHKLPTSSVPAAVSIKHVALPAFNGSATAAGMRAVWYRREHLSAIAPAAADRVVIFGFDALAALGKEWLTRESMVIVVSRLPAATPSWFKHKCTSLSATARFIAPTRTISTKLESFGIPASSIEISLPTVEKTVAQVPRSLTTPGFLVGVVCPLAADQGLETVIQAIQQSEVFIPDLKVFIIGDGPDKRRFTWLLAQTHLKDRVQIAANAADYHRFLHNLDVCIAPAVNDEGCDPVILHARAQGNAIIATDIPSHTEFVENGKTGLIYEAGNSHTLSQHLINLYTHRDWLEHYKTGGGS